MSENLWFGVRQLHSKPLTWEQLSIIDDPLHSLRSSPRETTSTRGRESSNHSVGLDRRPRPGFQRLEPGPHRHGIWHRHRRRWAKPRKFRRFFEKMRRLTWQAPRLWSLRSLGYGKCDIDCSHAGSYDEIQECNYAFTHSIFTSKVTIIRWIRWEMSVWYWENISSNGGSLVIHNSLP